MGEFLLLRKKAYFSYKIFLPFSRMKASTFNCELSDLDQSELKLGVNYAHVNDRDYWLFAWNPYDFSCRDKVATITGNRINSDRRIDVFKEPGNIHNSNQNINHSNDNNEHHPLDLHRSRDIPC